MIRFTKNQYLLNLKYILNPHKHLQISLNSMRTTVLCQGHHVSFNFNKLRAMVAARVLVGIQLERHLPGGSEECLHKNSEGI